MDIRGQFIGGTGQGDALSPRLSPRCSVLEIKLINKNNIFTINVESNSSHYFYRLSRWCHRVINY